MATPGLAPGAACGTGPELAGAGAPVLLTTGYQQATLDEVLDRLQASGVRLLLDVRAIPQSRKPGFSRRLLEASLAGRGIAYHHLRALGTPKPGRDAARAGDAAGLSRIFREHMRGEPAQAALHEAAGLVRRGGGCLFCFERDHALCHRAIVAEMIQDQAPVQVRHI